MNFCCSYCKIDHSMDAQYQRSTRQTKAVCLWTPIIWIMAAMLRDSVVVVVVVVHTRPRAIPLAKITTRKSTHGFPSLFYTCLSMGLHGGPLGRRSSAINNSLHLAQKYARIFARGHYVSRVANSFPRA